MELDDPVIDTTAGALAISWPLQKCLDHIANHPIYCEEWDTSIPFTMIVRGDGFPVAGPPHIPYCTKERLNSYPLDNLGWMAPAVLDQC
jgi:hypothetical protein|mmetsp:Transcript_27470/g.46639  ORF Transcript_27470/g.46639 Transcript_27470/m.46639 type:complete len:89 (+) Transcript_27470:488-754(+)